MKNASVGELGQECEIALFQVCYFALIAIYKINSKKQKGQTNVAAKINAD